MANSIDDVLNKIDTVDSKVDQVTITIHKIDKEVALQKLTFDEHIKQDEKMYEEFRRMNDILQQNTQSLKEHMHRTELLEELVTKIDTRLSPFEIDKIQKEAVNQYRNEKLKKYGKVLGLIATAIGILAALKPFLLKLLGL